MKLYQASFVLPNMKIMCIILTESSIEQELLLWYRKFPLGGGVGTEVKPHWLMDYLNQCDLVNFMKYKSYHKLGHQHVTVIITVTLIHLN